MMNRMNGYSYSIIGTVPEVVINYLKYKKNCETYTVKSPKRLTIKG